MALHFVIETPSVHFQVGDYSLTWMQCEFKNRCEVHSQLDGKHKARRVVGQVTVPKWFHANADLHEPKAAHAWRMAAARNSERLVCLACARRAVQLFAKALDEYDRAKYEREHYRPPGITLTAS